MKDKKRRPGAKVRNVTLLFLVLSLFLLLGGVTFSIYSKFMRGSTDNIIEAGVISFAYNEDAFQGNGVDMQEVYPIPDASGKILNGNQEYFDFSVNAHTTLANVTYQVIVLKDSTSTLQEECAKIYLTKKTGNTEVASPLVEKNGKVLTYDQLDSFENGGKVIYTGTVPKGEENYHEEFRLRLWLAEDAPKVGDYYNKKFSVKIKVVAVEVH